MKPEEIHALLQDTFPQLQLSNLSWQRISTLGAGHAASLVAEPQNDIELQSLLIFCHDHQIPVYPLGGGSNTVGSDQSFAGVVVRLCRGEFINIRCGRAHITAGAGVKLRALIRYAAEHGWGGMSALAGIPGTVGGSLRMNAGANGVSISDKVIELFGLDNRGRAWSMDAGEVKWCYRSSSIPPEYFITGAIFQFDHADGAEEEEKIEAELLRRKQCEPSGRSAGCFFRNPSELVSAGRLIDSCGGKGMRCGEAEISKSHANYLINNGGAGEKEFLDLAEKAMRLVYDATGIILRPEVNFLVPESLEKLRKMLTPIKVAVLKGGDSSEREVSLESGAAVAKALRNVGYEVNEIDIKTLAVTDAMREAEVVFPVLHGGFGESGELQKLLEAEGIEFVGCGSHACGVTLDKLESKSIMDENDLPTPPWAVVFTETASLPEGFSYPVVVKPPTQGSTVGITIAHNDEEWREALRLALKYDDNVLVEAYIKGHEITIGVVNGQALPPVEIKYPGEMYDYDAKYTHAKGETFYYCPPQNVSEELQQQAQSMALSFNEAIGGRDMIRIDFIVTDSGELYILEGNTIPGFTASSLLPKAAKMAGISFDELCSRLVKTAWNRRNK